MQLAESIPWDLMKGERCWHVSAGGATAPSFVLVLGKRIPRQKDLRNRSQPSLYRKYRGSVELLVWCSWRLETRDAVLASSDQGEAGLTEMERLVEARVAEIDCYPPAWDLAISFVDGRVLRVFCDHVVPNASFRQNWELWLPGVEVTAGPGSQLEIDYPPVA